jgi:hypothetical protein
MSGTHSIQQRRERTLNGRGHHPGPRRETVLPGLPEGSQCLMYTGVSAAQFAELLAPLPPARQIVLIEMVLQGERNRQTARARGEELPAIAPAQSRRLEKRRREREERAARIAAA